MATMPLASGMISGPGLGPPAQGAGASAERTLPERAPHVEPIANLGETRSLFWQNVVREVLMTFPMLASRRPEVSDGRIAVLTRHGERIPLCEVEPLFPCSIASPEAQALCVAVQATVFNVRTPSGEMFTIPLEEIRGLHTLTDELMKALENEARSHASGEGEGESEPFGFAAFSSLRRQQQSSPAAMHEPGI